MKYRCKTSKKRETKATNTRNRVSIHERPKEADGTRFGDWEIDLIVDKEGNAILTLLERSTNFMLIEKHNQETDISKVTDGKISKIRRKINAIPREKLNFCTPTEVFFKNIS